MLTRDELTLANKKLLAASTLIQNGGAASEECGKCHETFAEPRVRSWRLKLKDKVYKKKVYRSVLLNLSLFALGLNFAQLGPAFLDLQLITNTNVQQASAYVTAGSAGYVVGAFSAGFVYDLWSKGLLLVASVLLMGVCTTATPFCASFWSMVIISFLENVFGGSVETVGNADILHTWGGEKEAESAMQAIHFSFAFGGVVAPLITEPFLAPRVEPLDKPSSSLNNTLNSNNDNYTASPNRTEDFLFPQQPQTRVHYAYMITGAVAFVAVVFLAVEYVRTKMNKTRRRKRKKNAKEEQRMQSTEAEEKLSEEKACGDEGADSGRSQLPMCVHWVVLLWVSSIYLLHQGVEDTFNAYLASYVVLQLQWSKSQGALITSAFWISFAAGRFLCIFIVRTLSSVQLLVIAFLLMLASLCAFLLASLWQLHWGVWVSSVVGGASMSVIFPTGFSWVDRELLAVTGRVTSVIMLASSLGLIVNPLVLGKLMEERGAIWLVYILLGEAAVCVVTFLLLLLFSRRYLQSRYSIPQDRFTSTLSKSSSNKEEHPQDFLNHEGITDESL